MHNGVLELTPPGVQLTGRPFWMQGRASTTSWFVLRANVYAGGGTRVLAKGLVEVRLQQRVRGRFPAAALLLAVGRRDGGGQDVHATHGYWPPGKTGGMGLSINFGAARRPLARAAGDGLRLCFLSQNDTLQLWFDRRLVADAPMDGASVASGTCRGRAAGRRGDRVSLDGHVVMSHVVVPLGEATELDGVYNNEEWVFGFGARTGSDFDGHYLANMTLHTGAHLRVESVAVEVTLNHQSYTENDVQLSYMPPPAVSALSVDRGPEDGGTLVLVYGSNPRAPRRCAASTRPTPPTTSPPRRRRASWDEAVAMPGGTYGLPRGRAPGATGAAHGGRRRPR